MAASSSAPTTHRQPSRKGKRSWRKNVDISEVQNGLSAARDEEILTGGKLFADVPSESLFQTDSTGNAEFQKQYRKSFPYLKSDEILAQRSAIPAVDSRKRKSDDARVTDGILPEKRTKTARVSRKELERLRMIAYGGDAVHKDVIKTDEAPRYDPWEEVEVVHPPSLSFLDQKQAVREPRTLRENPLSLTASGKVIPNVSKPNAGRSYNPSFEDWSALVKREGVKEIEAEKHRIQEAEKERLKAERVAAAAKEAEKENDIASLEEYESEWEGFQSDMDEANLTRKRPQRKTPAERNKIQRRKAAERQSKHEAKIKARDLQAKQIERLTKDVEEMKASRKEAANKAPEMDSADSSEEGEQLRKRPLGGKNRIPNAPLEVVLADELQDSLRRLRPEGNLLKDRFRNMMVQGKVEARRPVGQTKKPKTKATQKWSYKDWQLPLRST